jgi:TPR repeat protein
MQGDRKGARTWYTRAAEGGHTHAMFNLALLLEEQGDIEGARTWRRRAADAGDTGFISKRDRSPQERGARRTH